MWLGKICRLCGQASEIMKPIFNSNEKYDSFELKLKKCLPLASVMLILIYRLHVDNLSSNLSGFKYVEITYVEPMLQTNESKQSMNKKQKNFVKAADKLSC